MRLHSFSKKALSMALCLLMLLSLPVFAAPVAVAENEFESSYDISFTFELTDGVSHTDYINNAYLRVGYRADNGYGEAGSVDFSFKENYASYLNDANINEEKEVLLEDVPGFPVSVEIYLKNSNRFAVMYDGASYHIYDMHVNGVLIWSGDMYVQTQGAQRQVVLSADGEWTRNTGGESGKEKECYCALSTEDTDYTTYHTVHQWVNAFPHADSIAFAGETDNIWANSLPVEDDNTTFTPATLPVCLDQYGVELPQATPSHRIVAYNGENYSPYTTMAQDIVINSTTGKITAGDGGFIAGGKAEHALQTKLRFVFGTIYQTDESGALLLDENNAWISDHDVSIISEAFATKILYPERNVTWSFMTSTDKENDEKSDSVSSTALFGDTVTDADFPGEENLRSYYAPAAHYFGGSYRNKRVDGDIVLYMSDYSAAEHEYVSYKAIEGNVQVHLFSCACGYGVEQAHAWDDGVITVQPICAKSDGIRTYTCTLCNQTKDEIAYRAPRHVFDAGVVTKDPACEETGICTYTCTICGDSTEELIGELGHKYTLHINTDENGNPASAYYYCDRNCGAGYWAAAEKNGKYTIADLTEYESPEAAVTATTLPAFQAPAFNTLNDATVGQDYTTRGASLRYEEAAQVTSVIQPLRFRASVKIPNNMNFAIGSAGNAVQDAGFVYSLESIVGEDRSALMLGQEQVYSISVKERNADEGVYDGSNWAGISKHELADGTYLTFNIVILVRYGNWNRNFVARSYVKYNYNGFSYTVYDGEYNPRSVEYVARQVVANSANESPDAVNYCQQVILNNLEG